MNHRHLGNSGLVVSDDSSYVALPCGPGNNGVAGGPPLPPYSTCVFRVEDLARPVVVIASGPRSPTSSNPPRVYEATALQTHARAQRDVTKFYQRVLRFTRFCFR